MCKSSLSIEEKSLYCFILDVVGKVAVCEGFEALLGQLMRKDGLGKDGTDGELLVVVENGDVGTVFQGGVVEVEEPPQLRIPVSNWSYQCTNSRVMPAVTIQLATKATNFG